MPVDHPRAQAAVRELLLAIGEDPDREGLRETPARVARALAEVFAGLDQSPQDFLMHASPVSDQSGAGWVGKARTGQEAWRAIFSVVLPNTQRRKPVRPWVDIAIKSQCCCSAKCTIESAASPSMT